MSLVTIDRELAREVDDLVFGPPVRHVYNPLIYARAAHEQYLERYGADPKEVVLVGMNPGPWGMAQTGVPFGDVVLVRDWLGIDAPVERPVDEHPKRPVTGFACERSEVSGSRLWGWAKKRFKTPEKFFSRFFVINYCPLVFLEESGRNRTPDKLPKDEKLMLQRICDRALRASILQLGAARVIGVGVYGRDAAKRALVDRDDIEIGCMLHPSPASPKANQGWEKLAEKDLREAGIKL